MLLEQNIQVLERDREVYLQDILSGLRKKQKELPSKYFYDERGSQLFDRICQLEEYYPTRNETAIMHENIRQISEIFVEDTALIEFGSGSSEKTRILLDALPDLGCYIPIDISKEHLYKTTDQLEMAYPQLKIMPVCADYTEEFELPEYAVGDSERIVYFPGSTIGNFHHPEAVEFLKHVAGIGNLLIGVDLKKDVNVLNRAYNDADGVTAEFNMNQLVRINDELNANFNIDSFRHQACYNADKGRIEMHIISENNQTVQIGTELIYFVQGESIWTESSYKYSLGEFKALAEESGFEVDKVWIDKNKLFSVQYLKVRD